MTLCGSKVSWRANLALVPLTVLLLSNVGHAAPPTPITTCGFEITTPGQYYLANDLLGCPSNGITILTSGVQLRLDGHAIQGSLGMNNGIHARGFAILTGILIQGPGTIVGFANGVTFLNVDFSNVFDVTATGNEVGLFLRNSSHNMVQGNVATENGFEGIDIIGGSENKVVNNLVTNNGVLSGRGIFVLSDLNEVHANLVTGNADTGIFLGFSTQNNNIVGNTALANGFFDMADNSPDCDDNQWRGNRFNTANQACIQ